jgi:hypothetical protein
VSRKVLSGVGISLKSIHGLTYDPAGTHCPAETPPMSSLSALDILSSAAIASLPSEETPIEPELLQENPQNEAPSNPPVTESPKEPRSGLSASLASILSPVDAVDPSLSSSVPPPPTDAHHHDAPVSPKSSAAVGVTAVRETVLSAPDVESPAVAVTEVSAFASVTDMDGHDSGPPMPRAEILTEDSSVIRCICPYDDDDGFTIQCERCFVWQHALCVGISQDNVPEEYLCERCSPRIVNIERATQRQTVRRQAEEGLRRARRDLEGEDMLRQARELAVGQVPASEKTNRPSAPKHAKRRSIPLDDSDHADAAPTRRTQPKRRMSNKGKAKVQAAPTPAAPQNEQPAATGNVPDNGDDSGFDETYEPWQFEYTPISTNRCRDMSVRQRLVGLTDRARSPKKRRRHRRHASRGSSSDDSNTAQYINPFDAVELPHLPKPPSTVVRPISHASLSLATPSTNAFGSASSNPSVSTPYPRATVHGLFSSVAISAGSFICEARGEIVPLGEYRADPVNQYSILGVLKPMVRAVGRPWSVAVDQRLFSNESRFIRSGCHPNAVVRPVVLKESRGETPNAAGSRATSPGGDGESVARDRVVFGVFATSYIGRREEVVLPWDWDDDHALHSLPSLLTVSAPDNLPVRLLDDISHRMASISTTLLGIVSCACEKKNDCAVAWMWKIAAASVMPSKAGVSKREVFEGVILANGSGREETDKGKGKTAKGKARKPDLGPLLGIERGWFETGKTEQKADESEGEGEGEGETEPEGQEESHPHSPPDEGVGLTDEDTTTRGARRLSEKPSESADVEMSPPPVSPPAAAPNQWMDVDKPSVANNRRRPSDEVRDNTDKRRVVAKNRRASEEAAAKGYASDASSLTEPLSDRSDYDDDFVRPPRRRRRRSTVTTAKGTKRRRIEIRTRSSSRSREGSASRPSSPAKARQSSEVSPVSRPSSPSKGRKLSKEVSPVSRPSSPTKARQPSVVSPVSRPSSPSKGRKPSVASATTPRSPVPEITPPKEVAEQPPSPPAPAPAEVTFSETSKELLASIAARLDQGLPLPFLPSLPVDGTPPGGVQAWDVEMASPVPAAVQHVEPVLPEPVESPPPPPEPVQEAEPVREPTPPPQPKRVRLSLAEYRRRKSENKTSTNPAQEELPTPEPSRVMDERTESPVSLSIPVTTTTESLVIPPAAKEEPGNDCFPVSSLPGLVAATSQTPNESVAPSPLPGLAAATGQTLSESKVETRNDYSPPPRPAPSPLPGLAAATSQTPSESLPPSIADVAPSAPKSPRSPEPELIISRSPVARSPELTISRAEAAPEVHERLVSFYFPRATFGTSNTDVHMARSSPSPSHGSLYSPRPPPAALPPSTPRNAWRPQRASYEGRRRIPPFADRSDDRPPRGPSDDRGRPRPLSAASDYRSLPPTSPRNRSVTPQREPPSAPRAYPPFGRGGGYSRGGGGRPRGGRPPPVSPRGRHYGPPPRSEPPRGPRNGRASWPPPDRGDRSRPPPGPAAERGRYDGQSMFIFYLVWILG